ncbi:MAG TPA: Asp-tRNA(Asn)/Glu-tRNA(Gln) amidotransferase subunit GatC [Stellaceae bacterium]|jgi:aspartyl-tRNA(Asn)/glutamyl-tRNA(Gln) amidotransferase subunit C|nr:Asp-tRNA(Asn)/Glu-tRNA(Gln) amidotransferase subunit GatC [Stellaceae bacterium]
MALDKATVARIAALARIRMSEEEQTRLAGELSQILTWIEQLGEVDTTGVEAMASVAHQKLPLREDKVTDGGIRDKLLANTPSNNPAATARGFFAVPKVVE